MSTQSNSYIMVGTKLPFDHFGDEDEVYDRLEPYTDSAYRGIEHHNGLCMVADGVGGRYRFVGRVLAKSDDQNGNYGFSEPIDATHAMTPELSAEVSVLLTEHFDIEKPDVRVWAFTHYR